MSIIAISLKEEVFTISEFIISPYKLVKGNGTTARLELLANAKKIFGSDINNVSTVIFPNNIASEGI